MRKMLVLLMLIPAVLLCSCSESEPLPAGESKLPDVEWDSSEIAENGWPSELLPGGFPEAPYSEIYSVERKDNEVTIIMFAENDPMEFSPCIRFLLSLYDNGYTAVVEEGQTIKSALNEKGVIVRFSESKDASSHLQSIESPTGYTYEIRVTKTEVGDDSAYLFWVYPSSDTDLGLEEITFDEWPSEYLPDNFPRPDEEPNTDIKIISMEQKKTGVYITIEGSNWDIGTYENNLYNKYGYNQDSTGLYNNKNGDYIYLHASSAGGMKRSDINQWTFQINKCNEHVKKADEASTTDTAG